MPTNILLAGLGFGDEGKGSFTDYLCHHHNAKAVIRYSGGAQTAHNVVMPNGEHHTFAQFGSGSFRLTPTYLSKHVVVNPLALVQEARAIQVGLDSLYPLKGIKVMDLIHIAPDALVTTNAHIRLNRLRELSRGGGRHGSCGMGIGETVRMAEEGLAFRASDLSNQTRARNKEWEITKAAQEEVRTFRHRLPDDPQTQTELQWLETTTYDAVKEDYYASVARRVDTDHRTLQQLLGGDEDEVVIFEGTQGMLLDPNHGFFPHVTRTDITFANANALINEYCPRSFTSRRKLGILRGHMTRHGAGPFPTETPDIDIPTDHNGQGKYQGSLRTGYLDAVLINYAIKCLGGVDGLAVSCLDMFDKFPKMCTGYQFGLDNELDDLWKFGLPTDRKALPWTPEKLLEQEALSAFVMDKCTPCYEKYGNVVDFLSQIQEHLGPVVIQSYGPTSDSKVGYSPFQVCR